MYDYEAQDTDEVSFRDGDIIIDAVFIDEGWMTGTVHRTGQTGRVHTVHMTREGGDIVLFITVAHKVIYNNAFLFVEEFFRILISWFI